MSHLCEVPDILDHRPDSSSSNESSPDIEALSFPRRESRDRIARPCRISLRTMSSVERSRFLFSNYSIFGLSLLCIINVQYIIMLENSIDILIKCLGVI